MTWSLEFQRAVGADGRVEVRLGHPVVDDYLEFPAARWRPNTVLAAGFDLRAFFTLFGVEPTEVTTADVLAFITAERASGDDTVVRMVDCESGLSARTIQRRLSMFAFLIVRGDVAQNPVPRGLSTSRPSCGRRGPRAEARSDFVGRQPSSRQVPPNARASISAVQFVDA
jgi:integrase/recombinase XerD